MRLSTLGHLTILLSLALSVSFCGANDSVDEDEENTEAVGGGSGGTSSSNTNSTYPTIDFELPSTLSLTSDSLNLTADDTKTIIERMSDRMNRIIEQMNNVLERLNKVDQVTTGDSFVDRGPNQNLSGIITDAATNDDGYTTESLLCIDGEKFLNIKWNTDKTKVFFVRNYKYNPISDPLSEDFIVEGTFVKSDTRTLTINGYGQPWAKPLLVTDGDDINEYLVGTIDDESNFSLIGVNNWFDASAETDETGNADAYLSGELNSAGEGQFVAYRKFNTILCDEAFDEGLTSAPGWCLGRQVGSDTRFTDDQRATAWTEIQAAISEPYIAKKENLKVTELSTELECPSS